MRVFAIDTDYNITVFASTEELGALREGTQSFTNEEELVRLAAGWPGSRLVEIWNSLGRQVVQKIHGILFLQRAGGPRALLWILT